MKKLLAIGILVMLFSWAAAANASLSVVQDTKDGGYLVLDTTNNVTWFYQTNSLGMLTNTFSGANSWASNLNTLNVGGASSGWSLGTISPTGTINQPAGSQLGALYNAIGGNYSQLTNAQLNYNGSGPGPASLWSSINFTQSGTLYAYYLSVGSVSGAPAGTESIANASDNFRGEIAVHQGIVPIPPSILLLVPGLAGLGIMRRARRPR